jgi:hypothetical protein
MAITRKPTRAAKATPAPITPAEFAEPFSAYLTAVHHALVNADSINDAAASLIAADSRLGELAAQATREVSDRIAASIRAAGPGGYIEGIRKAGAADLATVITAVADAMVSDATRQIMADAETTLAKAVEHVETAKAELTTAIETDNFNAMSQAEDVIKKSGPAAVDKARDAVVQAQLAVAQEAEQIAAGLGDPLAQQTERAKAAADDAQAKAERARADYEAAWVVSKVAEDALTRLGGVRATAEARVAEVAAEAARRRQELAAQMIGART